MFSINRRIILIISLVAINFIYFISSAYILTSNDGSHFALVSALVEEGSVKINNYVEHTHFIDYNFKDGDYYSDRPPGTAFLSIPFYLIGKLVQKTGLDHYLSYQVNICKVFVLFLPNIAGTIIFYLLYRLFVFFKFSFGIALFSSFIFSFGTLTWFESTRFLSHIVSMVTVFSAAFFVITLKKFNVEQIKHIVVFSALLALASIIEIQNILFILPFGIYLLLSKKVELENVFCKDFSLPFLLAILSFVIIYSILFIYNFAAFEEITIKSNKFNPAFPEESSFIAALSGNFFVGLDRLFTNFLNSEVIFDWAKGVKNNTPGLFVISPVLLLSLPGFYYFFKLHRNEALFFLLVILMEVFVVSFHKTVLTRHISTILPFIFFPIIFVVQKSFEQIKNSATPFLKRYGLFLLILLFSLLSIARVYYVMNSYWMRSLSSPFKFLHELPSFIFF